LCFIKKIFYFVIRKKRWYGNKNTNLFSELLHELPVILIWTLEGLKRLRERGDFLRHYKSTSLNEKIENITSPIKAFVLECCIFDQSSEITIYDLYNDCCFWYENNGYQSLGSKSEFGKNIRAAVPNILIYRPKDNNRRRIYKGIGLR